jgi:hypothetical protein
MQERAGFLWQQRKMETLGRLGVKNRAMIDPWKRRRCFDLPLIYFACSHDQSRIKVYSIPLRSESHHNILFRPWSREAGNKDIMEQACDKQAACF